MMTGLTAPGRRGLRAPASQRSLALLVLFLFQTVWIVGCDQGSTGQTPHPITVTILSPVTDQTFNPTTGVLLKAELKNTIPAQSGSMTVAWSITVQPENGSAPVSFNVSALVAQTDGSWFTETNLTQSPTGVLPDGIYTAVLSAKDAGLGSGSGTVTFKVDNLPPTIFCGNTEPPPDDITGEIKVDPSQDLTIDCTVADVDGPLSAIRISMDDSLEAPYYIPSVNGDGTFSILAEFSTPGLHYAYVIATDASGAFGTSNQLQVKVWGCSPLDGPDADLISGCEGDCDDGADPTKDQDLDGFAGCGEPGDCNDLNADVHPGVPEVCNGVDDDCDGNLEDSESDEDGDGFTLCTNDCDDTDANTYQGAPEICDGKDNNCDAVPASGEKDSDGDGYLQCSGCPEGVNCGDCDDAIATTSPGRPEICGNGRDDNCSGEIDEIYDGDNDGITTCEDCNDANPLIYPRAPEGPDVNNDGIYECDGLDNDCDQVVDDNTDCRDDDADGYNELQGDCDDYQFYTFPGAMERPDRQDNNCDGVVETTLTLGTAHVKLLGNLARGSIGTSLSSNNRQEFNADVNGDGFNDLLIGSELYDTVYTGQNRGAAFVLFGRDTGWKSYEDAIVSSLLILNEDEGNANAGHAVGIVGDLNGDSIADMAVGAPKHSGSGTNIGKTYVIFGKTEGWGNTTLTSAALSQIEGIPGATNVFLGYSVNGGDINGDGLSDLIFTAPWDDGATATGWVMIAPGKASGWSSNIPPTELARVFGDEGMVLGRSVGIGGYMNGDGIEDIVVGALHDADNLQGSVITMLGDAGYQEGTFFGMDQLQTREYYDSISDSYTGETVSGRVDIDNDGYDDMLVGRRNASSTVNFAYLIFGKESFDASNYITARAEIVFAPSYDGIDECPCTVQGIGDMNGDGLDDFAIGVSRSDANGDASGRIYIFYGRPSRADWGFVDNEEETTAQVQVPLDTADMMINGETAQDQAGLALAAGDLNNDGWQDLIVSAPYYDYAPSATENVGRVYVIFGYPPVRNPRPAN